MHTLAAVVDFVHFYSTILLQRVNGVLWYAVPATKS